MKKIINGKKYDTETATRVGGWDNDCCGNDFRWCAEGLYKKKTGEFFLHGRGGPMSKYAESCGNMTCGGEEIKPLTEEQAKKWAETHLDCDEYEELFGEAEE